MTDKPKAQTMRGKAVVHVEEPKRLPFEYFNAVISTDTLRPQDLIERFLQVLTFAWPTKAEWLRVEYGLRPDTDLERWCNPVVDPGQFDRGDDYLPDQQAVEQRHDDVGSLIAELLDALAEVAPEGCTFGASEGDGACFGFWSFRDPDDLMDEARDIAFDLQAAEEAEEDEYILDRDEPSHDPVEP